MSVKDRFTRVEMLVILSAIFLISAVSYIGWAQQIRHRQHFICPPTQELVATQYANDLIVIRCRDPLGGKSG
jgi:uncharacterized membrane protein